MKRFLTLSLLIISFQVFGQNTDIRLLRHFNLERNKSLDGTFRLITNSASPVSIGVPIAMFGYSLARKDTAAFVTSVIIGSSVVVATILTDIGKYSIRRDRPFVTYPDIEKESSAGSPSFPSGHTAAAFSLATSISIAWPEWYVVVPAYVWAGAVGYSRMDLGVHYPSDVLAGAIIGAGSAWLTYRAHHWLSRKTKAYNSIRCSRFL